MKLNEKIGNQIMIGISGTSLNEKEKEFITKNNIAGGPMPPPGYSNSVPVSRCRVSCAGSLCYFPFCSAAGLQTSCLLSFTRSQRNPCMHSLGVRELAPHVYHFLTFGFVVFFDWHTAPLPPFVLLLLLSVVNERE